MWRMSLLPQTPPSSPDALQAVGVNTADPGFTISPGGSHNGHENFGVGIPTGDLGDFLPTYGANVGIPPGARIAVSIGGTIWGWHVENLQYDPFSDTWIFKTHFDRGDPNYSLGGILTHVGVDTVGGLLGHHNDNGLDPKC
jgi:hypothetical protein